MDSQRSTLLTDIDAWLAAADRIDATLSTNRAEVEKGRTMIEQGSGLHETIATMSTTSRYLRMNDALAEFDIARFRLRSSLISMALAEGLSEEQLVKTLGVPPELAAQVLAELPADDRR